MSLDIAPVASRRPSRLDGLAGAFPAPIPLLAIGLVGLHFFIASSLSVTVAQMLFVPLLVISFVVWPRLAISLMFGTMLFQYFWIGVVMNSVTDDDHLKALSFTNPMVTYVLFLCSLATLVRGWKKLPLPLQRAIILGAIFVGLAIPFAALGMARESFASAFQYLRNYSGALIYLVIGAAFGLRLSLNSVMKLLTLFGVILAIYGFIEMLFPYDVYQFVHLTDYFHMKYADAAANRQDLVFYGIQDVITFLTVPFLNLSGKFGLNIELLRLVGPIFHFISFGYALSFFLLVAVMAGQRRAALLMLPVLLVIGAKGATVLVFFSLIVLTINRFVPRVAPALKILTLILTAYAALVLIYGSLSHDNHFDGLMSCLKGFATNPIGHGVGVGGNMSDTSVNAIQGGHDVLAEVGDFPMESAIGVLMYQMGVAGIVAFVVFWRFLTQQATAYADRAQRLFSPRSPMIIFPAAFAILLVNALFQEEVFTPTGWGMWLFLAGVLLAQKDNLPDHPAETTDRGLTITTEPASNSL